MDELGPVQGIRTDVQMCGEKFRQWVAAGMVFHGPVSVAKDLPDQER